MKASPLHQVALTLAILSWGTLAGCHSDPDQEIRVFGFLMSDGEPVEHGYLALLPLDHGEPTLLQTDDEGRFDAKCALSGHVRPGNSERFQVAFIRPSDSKEIQPEYLRDAKHAYRVEPAIIYLKGSERDFALELISEEGASNSASVADARFHWRRRG
ncbi:MAG: hypothetical protein AAGD07_22605 [Planctomycetota bacterium]